jgi:uncharacterized membrane protein
MRSVRSAAAMAALVAVFPLAAHGESAAQSAANAWGGEPPGRVTVEILDQPGLAAQASDEAANVIVGRTFPDGTFRWTREGGAERISETFSTHTDVSRNAAVVAGAVHWIDESGRPKQRAAVWGHDGDPQLLGPAYEVGSQATGVSFSGRFVVGYGSERTRRISVPFIWSSSSGFEELPLPSPPPGFGEHPGAQPYAVSEDGRTVVGAVWDALDGEDFVRPRGVMWVDRSPHALEDADGVALGTALACNADCSAVVGGATIDPPTAHTRQAFRWTRREGARYLETLAQEPGGPGRGSYVGLDVTADGRTVVGIYQYHDFVSFRLVLEGVIWDEEGRARAFRDCLRSLGSHALDGWQTVVPTHVSGDGARVVGWGMDAAWVPRSFVATFHGRC